MPFTAAHPAILLPLFRSRRFSATGLVTGAIAPDFEYFLKLGSGSVVSHTIPGIVLFNLPMAIGLAFTFHRIIRGPLLGNLPGFLKTRLADLWSFNFNEYFRAHYLKFCLSATLGVASHLGWDSLTHNGWIAEHVSFYRTISLPVGEKDYPLFFVLQQVSSVLGMLAILWYTLRIPRRTNSSPPDGNPYFWPLVFGVALSLSSIRLIPWFETVELADVVITTMSGIMVGLLLASKWLYRRSLVKS